MLPQALVQMSLHDANPRVATAASWGLAAACHALRHRKTTTTTAVEGPGTAVGAQMRALAGLPEDGAMRLLAQIVLTGQSSSSLHRLRHCASQTQLATEGVQTHQGLRTYSLST